MGRGVRSARRQAAGVVKSGTRVTIELEAIIRGPGSVDDYLEQTVIANPHVTLHYHDPEGNEDLQPLDGAAARRTKRDQAHPYGVELGRLLTMLKETKARPFTVPVRFVLARQPASPAICEEAKVSTRASTKRIGRQEADPCTRQSSGRRSRPGHRLHLANRRGLLLKGLLHVVPGQFYCAATRPPSVYRGILPNEVALAYGGTHSRAESVAGSATQGCRRAMPARCGSSSSICSTDWGAKRRTNSAGSQDGHPHRPPS